MKADDYSAYVTTFCDILNSAEATGAAGEAMALDDAVKEMGRRMRACHDEGHRILLIGNGGSAGIASHMATDISKNGGMRASAFNDGATLTCLGNDYGYEHVFEKQIEWHAVEGDILVAISSSGASANILNAVAAARAKRSAVFTLSGFSADNRLRGSGDINVYLPSSEYGFVEVGHLAVLHATLDIAMGWRAAPAAQPHASVG